MCHHDTCDFTCDFHMYHDSCIFPPRSGTRTPQAPSRPAAYCFASSRHATHIIISSGLPQQRIATQGSGLRCAFFLHTALYAACTSRQCIQRFSTPSGRHLLLAPALRRALARSSESGHTLVACQRPGLPGPGSWLVPAL